MISLSALDAAHPAPVVAPAGPLSLPLDRVHEDPDQPRTEFEPAALAKLADGIKRRGVKTPVSVRTYPNKVGHYILNFGARRYRASGMAGKAHIPAFVDEQHDAFDQVIENTLRDDLRPMELALFIRAQESTGMKRREIAERLSMDPAAITHHAALIDMPDCLDAVYRSGRCTSARTLYELRRAHEANPETVAKWAAGQQEITRATVGKLAERLKPGEKGEKGGKAKKPGRQARPVIEVLVSRKDVPDAIGVIVMDRAADDRTRMWVLIDGQQVQVSVDDCRIVAMDAPR